jgi:multicomponent Na+:H+ antiporter subunit E
MTRLKAVGWRIALFTTLWWVLAGHSPTGWAVGAVGILSATWVSMMLRSPSLMPFKLFAWLRFVPFFLWNSIRGGIDVALRVLRLQVPLHPSMVDYPMKLPTGPARVLFVNTVSLLPGTLSVRLENNAVTVHALDDALAVQTELAALEARVAKLF